MLIKVLHQEKGYGSNKLGLLAEFPNSVHCVGNLSFQC